MTEIAVIVEKLKMKKAETFSKNQVAWNHGPVGS